MRTFSSSDLLSHPQKLLREHIEGMLSFASSDLEKDVILFHDIAKVKEPFQRFIRDTSLKVDNKEHSLLSGYYFLLNSKHSDLDTCFGLLAILSHHGNIKNFDVLVKNDNELYLARNFEKSKEFTFWDEVGERARSIDIYSNIEVGYDEFFSKANEMARKTRLLTIKKFQYEDFINFKSLYSSLLYADKFEAIFDKGKEQAKAIPLKELEEYMTKLPFNEKRNTFREYVLNNFDTNYKLFALTAPTGYGKTLTALNFALKFGRERIIYVLPFTSIIDQTYDIVSDIYKENKDVLVIKAHHKTTVDDVEDKNNGNEDNMSEDRYSKIKFLMESFSGDINITTLYQLVFAIFGNKNRDNIKFNQLKDSVVIVDEFQAVPYTFRKDFIELCRIISKTLDTIFIFMSATMPYIENREDFKELSNLDYFEQQDRYEIKWLELGDKDEREANLIAKVEEEAKSKNTLLVVNIIAKAQELFVRFRGEYKTFCLNGYMYDEQKRDVIEKVKNLMNNGEKVLLVSTQSIEAGVDLDFDVGFREISPISSIIQTAGRVNRHFGDKKGILYLFDSISKYEEAIYKDLQRITNNMIPMFKEKGSVSEKEILAFVEEYFYKIHKQLETETSLIETEINKLAFTDINKKIDQKMSEDYKIGIIIEPSDGFIKDFEAELFEINNNKELEKFDRFARMKDHIKLLSKYQVDIGKKEKERLELILTPIRGVSDLFYLPYNSVVQFSNEYGVKKDINLDTQGATFT
jgi:CRISPR-associated helicase cas3